MDNLLTEAIDLTLFGMAFVFIFLALMVALTVLMCTIVQKIQPNLASAGTLSIQSRNAIDEDTREIIEKVIKMHTGA